MKWVFQLYCDPARHLIISLKRLGRILTCTQRFFSYTLDNSPVRSLHHILSGSTVFPASKVLPMWKGEVRCQDKPRQLLTRLQGPVIISFKRSRHSTCHFTVCDCPGRLDGSILDVDMFALPSIHPSYMCSASFNGLP